MANIKAKVRRNPQKVIAQTLRVGNIAFADLTDVDSSGQSDGGMVIYNATTSKYTVSTNISNQNLQITGGTY